MYVVPSTRPKTPVTFLLAVGSWLASLFFAPVAHADEAPTRPNIIVILADNVGYGDLSCYGQKTLKTPRLDAMAASGMRFTQFYAGGSDDATSRCVLLTGQHAGHAIVRGKTAQAVFIAPKQTTVASLLKSAGYKTAYVGKWGIGSPDKLTNPNDVGFDHFYGYVNASHGQNSYPEFLIRNGKVERLQNVVGDAWKKWRDPNSPQGGQGVAKKRVEYAPNLLHKDALRFVRENRSGPFFLCVSSHGVQANSAGGDNGLEVPDVGEFEDREWPVAEKRFAALHKQVDDQVGEILDLLVELKIQKNTLVIFTSDGGPHSQAGHSPDFFQSTGKLRGAKGDLNEGCIRVPTIAHWPGVIPAASENDEHWYGGDLLATAAQLAGAKLADDFDSASLVSTLQGKTREKHWGYLGQMYWESYANESSQALRFGKWKAIRKPMHTGEVLLFDMSNDAAEKRNYALRRPDLARYAQTLFTKWHTPDSNWSVGKN